MKVDVKIRDVNWWPLGAPSTLFNLKFCTNSSKRDFNLKKIIQNFALKRIGGAPKDHQFAPLAKILNRYDTIYITYNINYSR